MPEWKTLLYPQSLYHGKNHKMLTRSKVTVSLAPQDENKKKQKSEKSSNKEGKDHKDTGSITATSGGQVVWSR